MRTEDGYIIQQCLDGDASAFAFLVEKYKKAVYAAAYFRVRNFHDAQDITQEVFVSAYRNLRSLKRWDNFMGWLYRITANQCKMLMRARAKRPDSEFVEDQEQDILDQPSVDFYHESTLYESIQDALDSLPETYRQVMTLRYFGGMTVKEMSRFLGVSPGTIDRRLREARAQLREGIPAVISTAYKQNELPSTFTFRIVETVKSLRIHPVPRAAGLPWGLSLAAGIIIATLSMNPHLSLLNPQDFPGGTPLPVEMKVLKTGEIPVEILRISQTLAIASKQGDGDGGENRPNDESGEFLLAPQASEVKLLPRDGAEKDYFGIDVSIHGDYAIVGASWKDEEKGAAYIYNFADFFPVEPSGSSTTTFGGEKDRPALPDAAIPPPARQSIPKESRLLQNFPNPFNPETWLPYELASDANVTIWIYNSSGGLVRRLNPGSQEAGFYTTRDKAACWDGRNEAGEQVSSGTYFYTIQAGEFTATKKMAIVE